MLSQLLHFEYLSIDHVIDLFWINTQIYCIVTFFEWCKQVGYWNTSRSILSLIPPALRFLYLLVFVLPYFFLLFVSFFPVCSNDCQVKVLLYWGCTYLSLYCTVVRFLVPSGSICLVSRSTRISNAHMSFVIDNMYVCVKLHRNGTFNKNYRSEDQLIKIIQVSG